MLPVDGDAANAASVLQAFKVGLDFIEYAKAPFALASSWLNEIISYRNATLQRRFGIDHLGMPGGQILQWDENWNKTVAGTFGTDLSWTSTPGTGSIIPISPGLGAPHAALFNAMAVLPPTGAATATWFQRASPDFVMNPDLSVSVEAPILLRSVGTNNTSVVFGFSNGAPGIATHGAFFSKASADTNWHATSPDTGSTDLGVPPVVDVYQRARVELLGANVSDNGTSRANFYLSGVLVGHADNPVPLGTGNALSVVFGALTQITGGSSCQFQIGPIRYRQNLVSGDAFI